MIRTLADIRDAAEAGRNWLGLLRRLGPTLTANIWADLSYAAGIPVANYYASTPLVAAALESRDGIDIGPLPPAGMTKYLRRVMMIPGAANGICAFRMIDVCQYYPFVDGDGGSQDMQAGAQFTRYNGGEGCSIMVVSQGAGTGTVDVRVTYTSCNGTPGNQVTATLNLAATPGSLCSSLAPGTGYANPSAPFLPRLTGCRGVRSIENVEPLSPGGGIAAFVIAKPLAMFGMSVAAAIPVEVDLLHERSMDLPEIGEGAYLSMLALGQTGAAPNFHAETETVWG